MANETTIIELFNFNFFIKNYTNKDFFEIFYLLIYFIYYIFIVKIRE